MYQDRKKILREQELQRTVKQYLRGCREIASGKDFSFIDVLSYDELPCDKAEKAELRKIAEERLPELEMAAVSEMTAHCNSVHRICWPMNLYVTVFGEHEITLKDGAEKSLMSAIQTVEPIERSCLLKLYKEDKQWEDICDELDIYVTEFDERICRGLRKLRHPSRMWELIKYVILPERNEVCIKPKLSDELKKSAVRLVEEYAVNKDELATSFLQRHLKISYPLALELKEFIKEAL